MPPNFANQTMWTGDNLPILRGLNSASVDLIYLDPPFNSKANYAAPIGSQAAGAAFKDTWGLSDVDAEWINLIEAKHPAVFRVLLAAMTDGDKSYLAYMAARLLELRRVLKPSGSIYLHCDPTMSHYLKLLMDAVFGRGAFRNEVVWQRTFAHSDAGRYGAIHDVLLFYAGGESCTWNTTYQPYDAKYLRRFRRKDADGRAWADDSLTAKGLTGGATTTNTRASRRYGACRLNPCGHWMLRAACTSRARAGFGASGTWTNSQGGQCNPYGETLARSTRRPRNGRAIRHRNRSRCYAA